MVADIAGFQEEERRFLRRLQSEIAVPLLVGDKVVGVVAAVSFAESAHKVRRVDQGWWSEQQGIHVAHTSLIEFHARWIGAALETINQIMRRERRSTCLSIATRKLRDIIALGKSSDQVTIAGLVAATHHDGLRFRQAMMAHCSAGSDGKSISLRGNKDSAWGSASFAEQNNARSGRNTLSEDIDGALRELSDPRKCGACLAIRCAWSEFHCELRDIPEMPCLIVRQESGTESPLPQTRLVRCVVAEQGSDAEQILRAFCQLFHIDPASEAGRQMRVGMVGMTPALSSRTAPSPILCVTNVGFRDLQDGAQEETYVDELSCESVNALQELAAVLSLAGTIVERNPREPVTS
jgi:hypothetical protein